MQGASHSSIVQASEIKRLFMSKVSIQAGELSYTAKNVSGFNINGREAEIEDILDFGSRENEKRGFLFVSKILGKHIPCRPSLMRQSYEALAAKIQASLIPGDVWVVGMAETAIALGGGVADSLAKICENNIVFSHTTRYALPNKAVLIETEESHSHATTHLVYDVDASILDKSSVTTLVLVDDEITTGNTLESLMKQMKTKLPNLKNVIWVSLVSWLPKSRRESLGTDIHLVSLFEGEFEFSPNSQFKVTVPDYAKSGFTRKVSNDTGRIGLSMKEVDADFIENGKIQSHQPIVVVGCGEFMVQPFLWAEAMENEGFDVLFQATTKSPILEGDAIKSRLPFELNGEIYRIYNLPENRLSVYAYESMADAIACGLHKAKPGMQIVF